jgi:hypothetical protein
MPHNKPYHHKKPGISIFNKIIVNVPVKQEQKVNDESKEDGCTDCFKALFKCLRPGQQ